MNDYKSPIPSMALAGMWIMLCGIILILIYPLIGIPAMTIGFLMGILPERP